MGIAQLAWNGTDVCAMDFEPSGVQGLPDRALQASWNFMEVAPTAPETRELAHWEDCDGVALDYPAWLDGPQGAYLSHVLLKDDAGPKQQALMAIILHHVPELGPTIAAAALAQIGRVALYTTFDEAYAAIAAMGPGSLHPAETEAELAAAREAEDDAQQAWETGAYIEVLPAAVAAHAALVEAYAWCQLPEPGEVRAFWNHDGTGPWPGDWERSAALLAGNGLTAVLPNMLWGGLAHYPSNLLPRSDTYYTYGDQIAQCLEACSRNGLAVHVWKVNWNLANAPQDFVTQMRAAGRTQQDVWGRDVDWLCPSNPLNRALERDAMCEVAAGYDVTGLHFDYIRYPDETCCYCGGCRARFEADRGAPVPGWPLDCYTGPLHDEYRDWRALQITRLVHEVHDAAKLLKPAITISAAVFADPQSCRETVGQDWVDWVDRGYLDLVMPMDYTDRPADFAALVAGQLAVVGGRIPVYPGIGASSPGLREPPCFRPQAFQLGAQGGLVPAPGVADEGEVGPDHAVARDDWVERVGGHDVPHHARLGARRRGDASVGRHEPPGDGRGDARHRGQRLADAVRAQLELRRILLPGHEPRQQPNQAAGALGAVLVHAPLAPGRQGGAHGPRRVLARIARRGGDQSVAVVRDAEPEPVCVLDPHGDHDVSSAPSIARARVRTTEVPMGRQAAGPRSRGAVESDVSGGVSHRGQPARTGRRVPCIPWSAP
jgi:uncharacterized lipoprotein YddW (UPF0748 family)